MSYEFIIGKALYPSLDDNLWAELEASDLTALLTKANKLLNQYANNEDVIEDIVDYVVEVFDQKYRIDAETTDLGLETIELSLREAEGFIKSGNFREVIDCLSGVLREYESKELSTEYECNLFISQVKLYEDECELVPDSLLEVRDIDVLLGRYKMSFDELEEGQLFAATNFVATVFSKKVASDIRGLGRTLANMVNLTTKASMLAKFDNVDDLIDVLDEIISQYKEEVNLPAIDPLYLTDYELVLI